MRRGGGGRGGRGGGRGGGYGRRDTRPGGGASRDDRVRRSDYRPHRSPSPPDRGARRPRGEDDDRDPPHRRHVDHGDHRDPPRRRDMDYVDPRDPPSRGHLDCNDPRDVPGRERRGYDVHRDPPHPRHTNDDDARDLPRHGRSRDYGDDRGVSPGGRREYERAPYRHERPSRGGSYDAPLDYMLPDHSSDLGRPSLRSGKKERDYFGGLSNRSLNRDIDYIGGGSCRRSIDRERELFGDGVTLRISATELGRTSTLYQDHRSPPPPLYPSVPSTETGFLTGGSAMKADDSFDAGGTRLLRDDGEFEYRRDLRDPYVERSREIEKDYLGSRDVLAEKDGRTDRLYSAGGVPVGSDIETERFYSSRVMLGSGLVPCTQLKVIDDSSSALLAKDQPYKMHSERGYESSNGYIMDGLDKPSHDSLIHGSGHAFRLSGSSLERGSGHGDDAFLDMTRQTHSKHATRAESMEYNAHDAYVTRGPINGTYIAPDNLHRNVSHNSRHMSGSASLRGLKDERINHSLKLSHRMEEDEDSFQVMHHDRTHSGHHSYDGYAAVQYRSAGVVNDREPHSPGTEPIEIARQSAHQHEFDSFEDLSDQEVSPMVSRKRYRSPSYRDHEMDMHQADDGFTVRKYYGDHMDAYDLSSPIMRGSYDMVDDEDEYDARYEMQTSRNVFSRLALPGETVEEWTDVDQGNHPHSISAYGRPKRKSISQRLSRPLSQSQFGGPSIYGREGRGGLTKSAKKRLRTAHHQFHDDEDNPNGSEVKHDDASECEDLPIQKDPPEGSEEFSKQVHQAFLKYAKILNESPTMQKKYREASKGSLSCCVCGSVARKFPDLDALLSHAYNTCKVGLKTKHLGFHKALCVLMGWNWHVAPDTSKAHHSIPVEEVNAMKGDLMLWPPVVVVHNRSIANKARDTEAKTVSVEEMAGVLADIGVAREKARVSHGTPANQSIFLVKFQPTISGFQEAMRVHDHFSTRNHGKEEFQQIRAARGKKAAPIDNLEELLYAHIAVVEDLGYLDEETKRRCIVRSKKDIAATADATLSLEP